jgi:hypothetical protein
VRTHSGCVHPTPLPSLLRSRGQGGCMCRLCFACVSVHDPRSARGVLAQARAVESAARGRLPLRTLTDACPAPASLSQAVLPCWWCRRRPQLSGNRHSQPRTACAPPHNARVQRRLRVALPQAAAWSNQSPLQQKVSQRLRRRGAFERWRAGPPQLTQQGPAPKPGSRSSASHMA